MRAANLVAARAWLDDFARSPAFAALAEAQQGEASFACGVIGSFLAQRNRALAEMDREDVAELLLRRFPYSVVALDSDAFVDAVLALLIWAAKTGRVAREVEYACRKLGHPAKQAMRDGPWSASKGLVMAAHRDGVALTDDAAVRAHALGGGNDPRFVDEFLPPSSPVSLGGGRWLHFPDWS